MFGFTDQQKKEIKQIFRQVLREYASGDVELKPRDGRYFEEAPAVEDPNYPKVIKPEPDQVPGDYVPRKY